MREKLLHVGSTFERLKQKYWGLNIFLKVLIIALLVLNIPTVTLLTIYSIFPFLLWLYYPTKYKGGMRGFITFVYATASQFFIVFMSWMLIGFDDSGGNLSLLTLIAMFVFTTLLVMPVYIVVYRASKLNIREPDGVIYTLLIILSIIAKSLFWYTLIH